MALTPAQETTFKTHIEANADATVIAALAAGAHNAIADWYNLNAVPDYWIFRKTVSAKELSDAINLQNIADITTADSDRVVKFFQIRSFDGGAFSGESLSDRTAWDDVFSVAAGDESQQAIALLWQRIANNFETVFALSTGVGSNADPDTTSLQGSISTNEVSSALANG